MSRNWWNRVGDGVLKAGDVGGDGQVGEAFEARWWHPLADGTFAVISRYYYVAERGGQLVLEGYTEYLVCASLDDPGSTERWSGQSAYGVCDGEATDAEAYGCAEWGCRPLGDDEWAPVAPGWAVLA